MLIFLSCIVQFTSIFNIYITGTIIDNLIEKNRDILIYLITSIFFLELMNIVFSNISQIANTVISTDIVFEINNKVLQHVKKLPFSYFENLDTIYLNNQINSDVNTIVDFIISTIINFIVQIIILFSVSIIMIKINIFAFILSILTLPIYIILLYFFENKMYDNIKIFKTEQNKFMSKLNRQIKDIFFVKVNSIFDKLDNELKLGYLPLRKSIVDYAKINSIFSSVASITDSIFFILLVIYGSYSILRGNMSVGEFIMIKSYHSTIMISAGFFLGTIKSIPEVKVSIDRLSLIDSKKIENNGDILINNIKSIKLENLCYKNILQNINFTFEKGNLYLIKGNNGSGKTTLIKNITGCLINDYQGTIKINDFDIKEINMYELRKEKISFVEQQPIHIYDNFYDNINLKKIHNESTINSIFKDFNLDIKNIHKKIEIINDDITLSGGEGKKLAIIRALIEDGDIIFMDEPNAYLDKETQQILFDKIKLIKKNKIIVIVTHDNYYDSISSKIIHV